VVRAFGGRYPFFEPTTPKLDEFSVRLHATRGHGCRASSYREGADRRPLNTTPPTVPKASISTAPPSTANSEPEPPDEECVGAASVADPRGARAALPAPPLAGWAGMFDVRDPECGAAPELRGPMPAPKRAPEERPPGEGGAPVCLACERGSAYSLAAGEPGSICTPGSSAAATGGGTVAPRIASNATFTHKATDKRTRSRIDDWSNGEPTRGGP
jgi:hypothetical protein